MISALRKFARKNEDAKSRAVNMPSGVTSMGQSLQRKFARGVQYNMKIIIKGDRNTGKSTLLGRFQGKPFKEEYIPTNEIQVCSINWSYRVSDEVVKVEVWDVVDKGKKKSTGDGLKLANKLSTEDSSVLDAEFLDVYKGTHGCIIMLDVTKQWTYKYIERELPKIPDHIPVLVLANYLDMDEHRVVQLDEVISFINTLERGKDAAMVEYGECCMKNSFGLKFIHKFFNIPFLKLQRETLEQQLEVNKEDMKSTLEELSFHRDSEEQDYNKFLTYMEKKTKEKNQALENDLNSSSSSPNLSSTSLKSPSVSKAKKVLPKSLKTSTPQKSSIDDFVPRDTIDLGFLGETEKEVEDHRASSDDSGEGSDSENEGNPMVSGFQDISSTEEDGMEEAASSVAQQPNVDVDIEITSDEESEDEVVASVPVVQAKKKTDRVAVGNHKTAAIIEDKTLKTKNDDILNDESSSFMDAWLDSADINPPELKKSDVKSGGTGLFGGNELDMFAASQLNPKTSYKPVAQGEEHDSSDDIEDEKKKRHSEKKNKEGEESKHKHRSKHKHKRKSKVKDDEEEEEEEESESAEKKTKSKKKHRHKTSREKKKEGAGNYESF